MAIESSVTFFTALTVAAVTMISYVIFQFSAILKNWLISKVTISFEVTGAMDPCPGMYRYTLDWLEQTVPEWSHPHVSANTNQEESGRTTTTLRKPPGFETSPHYFKHDGAWIQVTRERLGEKGILDEQAPIEGITFRTLRFNGNVLSKILTEVRSRFDDIEPEETRTRFYQVQYGSQWVEFGYGKKKRPLNSVILNEDTLNRIINDVREFRASEDWYCDRGIPYRRGYLLYGPAGNGKSSVVKAIAGEFGYDICILTLSSADMNDDSLNNLMNSTPENSIILLEDIDAAFPSRDIVDDDDSDKKPKKDLRSPEGEVSIGKVTLRGLLNALDGVAATEGRIVIMTTNYVDKLDSAMTRPGRVDMKIMISLPTNSQIEQIFTRFYPNAPETDRDEFVKVIRSLNKPVSMAMIQGWFMFHKQNHAEVIASAVDYFDNPLFTPTSSPYTLLEKSSSKTATVKRKVEESRGGRFGRGRGRGRGGFRGGFGGR